MAAQNANKTTHGEDTKDDNHEAYMVGIYLYTLMCVSTVHSVLYRVLWKKRHITWVGLEPTTCVVLEQCLTN